eukprot:GHVS01085448.1.p1 GENE.GHVS01085448.1~~GHVS01085448.1.p1  ORF type:complete len:227 (+),score=32.40 GHVS01085448.1:104-784(+)
MSLIRRSFARLLHPSKRLSSSPLCYPPFLPHDASPLRSSARRFSLRSLRPDFDFETEKSKVQVISSMTDYDSLVASSPNLLVGFFFAQSSTPSLVLQPLFASMALDFPDASFFTVDVDVLPRAAYHADIQSVPTVVLMYGDDAVRERVEPLHHSEWEDLLPRAKVAVEGALRRLASSSVATRSTRSWYSHNIEVDNLNVYNTGWVGPAEEPLKLAMEKGGAAAKKG